MAGIYCVRIYSLHRGGETRCQGRLNSDVAVNGIFSQYALVPVRYLLLLQESIGAPDEGIATVRCSGATADAALEHIWIMQHQRVAISGTGGHVSFLSGPYKKATHKLYTYCDQRGQCYTQHI